MRTSFLHRFAAILLGLSLAAIAVPAGAQSAAGAPTQSFSDVPPTNAAFDAVEYLKSQGILSGYSDGTFKPNNPVGRAEAVKMMIAQIVPADQLSKITTTPFTDVPAGSWYLPYVEAARQLNIVDGPPAKTTFKPTDPVTEAAFFKIFMLAQKIDVASENKDMQGPLSDDVTDATAWYYPLMRYAVASSMTMVDEKGNLGPSQTLTRGDVANFMYRYAMFKAGRRTQALLSEAENDILNVVKELDGKNIDEATRASNRSMLAADGALASKPNEPIVQAAMKTTQGFQALVQAYQAGIKGDLPTVLTLTSNAWHLADDASKLAPSLQPVTAQMQSIAKSMADEARRLQSGG